MEIQIEISSREDLKKDLLRFLNGLMSSLKRDFSEQKRPPFGLTPKRRQEIEYLFKNLVFACFEVPGEIVKRSVLTGTLAAIILYPIAYYSFLAYLVSYLLNKLFKLTGKYFGKYL